MVYISINLNAFLPVISVALANSNHKLLCSNELDFGIKSITCRPIESDLYLQSRNVKHAQIPYDFGTSEHYPLYFPLVWVR